MVERAAHDGFVVGSNPAKLSFKMDFNSKNYQNVKLRKKFQTNGFFFLFHSAKLDLNKWIQTEQNLKKLKLNYSKTLNGIVLKSFKNSTFKNLSLTICNFVLFINPNFKTTQLQFSSMKKNLKPSFKLISVKLNNKIYATSQLKGLNILSYKKNVFELHKSLDQHLKTSYLLTKKKAISK